MVFILALVCCLATLEAAPKDYSGYKTLRVSDYEREAMEMLADAGMVDILSEGPGYNADILVSPQDYPDVMETLSGANFQVLCENVEEEIESERKEMLGNVPGVFDFKNFYAVKYQHGHIDKLVAQNRDRAETFSIGKTFEGRDLKIIRISSDVANSAGKPIIWVDGGIHAREWVSSHTALYIANSLLGEVEPTLQTQLKKFLDEYQIMILPNANPDGYEFSRTGDRFWRKTRKPSGCKYNYERRGKCTYGPCWGSDPNRNWNADFAGKGVSTNPCNEIYPGKFAFSEENTQAMRDFLLKNIGNIKLYLSFHSYSQLFLKPLGFELNPPKDGDLHNKVAKAVTDAIYATHGKVYRSMRAVELYPNSGSSMDWAYLNGVTHSYTIELRDTGIHGFKLPPQQIIPTGEENIRGLIALLNAIE